MSTNPLQKYFRQPKIFISLPSKGMFYKEGSLIGDANNMPILAMSGMDEIIMKTPDALFSGEATVKLIESCCPYIKNAKEIPSLDVDALLTGIRIATYGNSMTISHRCSKCSNIDDLGVNLNLILEHYTDKKFENQIYIDDNLTINLKPLTYKEISYFNIENFKLQKMLSQLSTIENEEEQQKHLDGIYQNLAYIQIDVLLASIESITTPEETITNIEFIKEWLSNTPSINYNLIKEKLEQNKKEWNIPLVDTKCSECSNEEKVEITLDQSSFF
jgi:hypothetical protein